jgi:hypothetical protein
MSEITPAPSPGRRRFFSGRLGPKDLLPNEFPAADWAAGKAVASLQTLRSYVAREATQAADWYIRKRSLKRRAGQAARLAAMVAVAAAGVLPVLAQILGQNGQYAFPPAWATILLAAAALLVSLDYFFGFTSGWIRYLEADQKIVYAVYDFQFDWEVMRTNWVGREPTTEEVRAAIRRLKEAMLQVQKIVEDETAAWAAEFRGTIQRLDEAARARAESPPTAPGATVVVTNGASIGEWTLAVDGGDPTTHTGTRCALVDLRPGPHKFVAEGRVNGQVAHDEVTAEVRPSGVTEISLTLR